MKIFVINLKRRPDRLAFMQDQLTGYEFEVIEAVDGNRLDEYKGNYKVFENWIDPLLDRKLTAGEIATSLSHLEVWKRVIKEKAPCIVLEDDSKIREGFFDEEALVQFQMMSSYYDMIYLNHKEMIESKSIADVRPAPSSAGIYLQRFGVTKPYYPYWANAYVMTARMATHLVESEFINNIIPVDELFPIINGVDFDEYCLSNKPEVIANFKHLQQKLKTKEHKIIAMWPDVFEQLPRSEMGSDTENSTPIVPESFEPVTQFFAITAGTDESKMQILRKSAHAYRADITNIGQGIVWQGGDMQGPGGGHKLNIVKDVLQNSPVISDNDIIMFVDAYDVIINAPFNEVIEKFTSMKCDILFAAEKNCWPNPEIAKLFPSQPTNYKFLNSGCYIGRKKHIQSILNNEIGNADDDQFYLQLQYLLRKDINISIDYNNEIFQCLAGAEESLSLNEHNNFVNSETNTNPLILHCNGGKDQKLIMNSLFNDLFGPKKAEPSTDIVVKDLGNDILHISNFLSIEECNDLIFRADSLNLWKTLPGDKFPGQEVRVKNLGEGVYNFLRKRIESLIYPVAERHWFPLAMYGVRDIFLIKFDTMTQSELPCHHDASLVSALIKLNSDYKGGETFFYRQEYDNIDVPVGDAIIWPGQVTHGHESRQVTEGVKYNLVIWTSRYNGDIN